jgi:hypothetical protein
MWTGFFKQSVSEAIPVAGRGGHCVAYVDNRLMDGGDVVSLTLRLPSPSRRFLELILSEAEWTQRPQCGWKDLVN